MSVAVFGNLSWSVCGAGRGERHLPIWRSICPCGCGRDRAVSCCLTSSISRSRGHFCFSHGRAVCRARGERDNGAATLHQPSGTRIVLVV